MEVVNSPMEAYFALRKERAGTAKRCLFGTPSKMDRQRIHSKFQEENRQTCMDFKKRWAFDCSNDTPVKGAGLEWEAVDMRSIPSVYHKMVQVTCYGRTSLNVDMAMSMPERQDAPTSATSQDQAEGSPGKLEDSGVYSSSDEGEVPSPSPDRKGGKRKRTKITDYFRATKKRRTSAHSVKRLD